MAPVDVLTTKVALRSTARFRVAHCSLNSLAKCAEPVSCKPHDFESHYWWQEVEQTSSMNFHGYIRMAPWSRVPEAKRRSSDHGGWNLEVANVGEPHIKCQIPCGLRSYESALDSHTGIIEQPVV